MSDEAIRQALKKLSNYGNRPLVFTAEVKSVDWDKRTCVVITKNGLEFENVRLRAVADDAKEGVCLKPKKGSKVSVAELEGIESMLQVVGFTEVEAIEVIMQDVELTIQDGKVNLKAKEIIINDGDNKGVPIVEKVKGKLNDIENKVNEILTTLNSVSVALAPSGSFPFAPIFSAIQSLQSTQLSEIENSKVKH